MRIWMDGSGLGQNSPFLYDAIGFNVPRGTMVKVGLGCVRCSSVVRIKPVEYATLGYGLPREYTDGAAKTDGFERI